MVAYTPFCDVGRIEMCVDHGGDAAIPTSSVVVVAVADLAESVGWYSRLLDRGPDDWPTSRSAAWRVGTRATTLLALVSPPLAGTSVAVMSLDGGSALACADRVGCADRLRPLLAARFVRLVDPDGNLVLLSD